MLDERRKYERFDLSLIAAVKAEKYEGELFAGEVKNISAGGICFESPDIEPVLHAPLELEIKHPERDEYVSIHGTIAWKEQFDNRCLVGIDLTDIANEAVSDILSFAQR